MSLWYDIEMRVIYTSYQALNIKDFIRTINHTICEGLCLQLCFSSRSYPWTLEYRPRVLSVNHSLSYKLVSSNEYVGGIQTRWKVNAKFEHATSILGFVTGGYVLNGGVREHSISGSLLKIL